MGTVLRQCILATVMATSLGACADADTSGARPAVVVTTNILGEVVTNLVGSQADVDVLMETGVDPHEFEPSARQVAALREADAVVVNGLGFEEPLLDAIAAAEADGVAVITATDAIDASPLEARDDPHFFTDPLRMRLAVESIVDELAAAVPELSAGALADRETAYLAQLDALHAEVEALVAEIPQARRLLVTNHEVFGYFADRYGFEVIGVVVPGGSTLAEPGAAGLAELAHEIEEHQVPAIFTDDSSSSRLADALAAEGAGVAVIRLFSESLGEPGSGADTYVGMVRTNAERIVAALR